MAIQLVMEESPVVLLDLFEQSVPFIHKQGHFPLRFKRELPIGNQLVANTRFLVALATSESQFRAL